ncbi:branched-chain amino acid transport system II carrier protein [uncultured Granulicatella sp.]|uniref:branched-chain amino acid transport system II carrier protein n=1 Tax=uncultured Granulicatella sp. TaxID=316089 RepID=UPI0028D88042|nr:branched-chain amino acid transport system II carrier protein [uncultured Granulicatella sp.]
MSRKKITDIIICGFALFAIFFGAGNLIFPPYLGVISGNNWGIANIAFLLSDPLLPILGVIVTALLGGQATDLGKRVSKHFSIIIGAISIILIGPLFAVPRTGATTHEIFVQSFVPTAPQWITSLIFFGLTLYIAIHSHTVIDAIGKYLTPILLFILLLVFIGAVIQPNAGFQATTSVGLFSQSFKEGYQTMDALGAALMAGVVISDLTRRGYTEKKEQHQMMFGVGIVSFILLALVYSSLTYAGATVSTVYDSTVQRPALLISLIEQLLGSFGKVAMGIAVSFACLTTSVGLITTCGHYFSTLTNGKLEYKKIVVVSVVISFLLSLLGVDALLQLAVPVLSAIYPMVIALIFLSIFDRYIVYNWTYTGAVVGAFFIGGIQAIHLFSQMQGGNFLSGLAAWTNTLPLHQFGFEWLVPAIIGSVVFTVISKLTGVGSKRIER